VLKPTSGRFTLDDGFYISKLRDSGYLGLLGMLRRPFLNSALGPVVDDGAWGGIGVRLIVPAG